MSSKYIIYTSSALFFLFFSTIIMHFGTSLVLADPPKDLEITTNPPQVQVDSGTITIDLRTGSDYFSTTAPYTFRGTVNAPISQNGCANNYTISDDPHGTESIKVLDSKHMQVTTSISSCSAVEGTFHFSVWSGKGYPARNTNSIVVEDATLAIGQKGGQLPTIVPLQSPLQIGQKPKVIVQNARAGNTYTFWWDGSKTGIAGQIQATSDGNLISGELKDGSGSPTVDFNKAGAYTLCYGIGNISYPAFQSKCTSNSPPAVFVFQNAPNTAKSCNIVSSNGNGKNPTSDDDVSITGNNLDKNAPYKSNLISKGSSSQVDSQNSDNNGNVSLKIGSKLSQGSYEAQIVDQSNKEICRVPFTVGQAQTGVQVATVPAFDCKRDGGCTSAAGDLCPGGVKTAIGCIPTSPAPLINAFLRFSLAAAGGIALLLMGIAGVEIITSAGNAETLKNAHSRFTQAIIGLIFVVLATFLLQIIGVDILGILKG